MSRSALCWRLTRKEKEGHVRGFDMGEGQNKVELVGLTEVKKSIRICDSTVCQRRISGGVWAIASRENVEMVLIWVYRQ